MQPPNMTALLIAAIVGLVGFFWTMLTHRKTTAVKAPDEAALRKAEATAEKATQGAAAAREAAVKQAEEERDRSTEALVLDLVDKKDELLKDDAHLTEYLKDVGKNVRGDGGG